METVLLYSALANFEFETLVHSMLARWHFVL